MLYQLSYPRKATILRTTEVMQQSGCGQGRIRTSEALRNRFTVCPLWPLGNLPMLLATIGCKRAGGGTRTPDLLITNQLLYQLSYASIVLP